MAPILINREKVIVSAVGLPSFPEVVLQILELLDESNCDFYDLANLIEHDPVISARVMSLANNVSDRTQNRSQIHDIYTATSLIGMTRVQEIALVSKLAQFISQSGKASFSKSYWLHSVAVAIAAQELAVETKTPIPPGINLIAGLLHDIGQLWLSRFRPQAFERVKKQAMVNAVMIETEELLEFGVTHADIGGWLAEYWKLPTAICEAIRYHHQPEKRLNNLLVPIIAISEVLANALDIPGRKENQVTQLSSAACKAINLRFTDAIQPLFGRIDARSRHAMPLFGTQSNPIP